MTNTIEALEQQLAAVQEALNKERGKADAVKQVQDLVEKLGYTVEELFAPAATKAPRAAKAAVGGTTPTGRKKYTKTKPMYQSPLDKRQSWVGPSRPKPAWVIEWEEAGKDIEDCRVK